MTGTPSFSAAQAYPERANPPGLFGAWECLLPQARLSWTEGVYDLFGLPRGFTLRRDDTLALYEESSRREMDALRSKAISTGKGFTLDCRIRSATGEKRWMRLLVGVGYENGRPSRIFGSKQDVTAEKTMWSGLSGIARKEPPTEIRGRPALEKRLCDAIAGQVAGSLALVIVDATDRSLGLAACADVSRQVETRLGRLFPDALMCERIGPGEFALLLPLPGGARTLAAMLEWARALLSRPIPKPGHTAELALAIGAAALKASHREQPRALVSETEAALLAAKAAGRSAARVFGAVVTPLPVQPAAGQRQFLAS